MAHRENVIIDIMKQIGFEHGFHIPVANEENQLLEKELEEMLKKKAELLVFDESLDNELQEGKNTLNNLSNQVTQNQKLIIAFRQQSDTLSHMLNVNKLEKEKLIKEKKAMEKQLNEMNEDQNKLESELRKTDDLIAKKRETIEWGEETLLAWNNDLAKRNTDVNILEAYHLEDNNRFKELDLRRQQLQRDVIERELIVEKEVSELLQVERELEQTAKLNRQTQQERNHLLEQWENAVNFLNTNQKDTQKIVEEINKIREVAREIYDNKKENEQKFQDYKEENEELECEVDEIKKLNDEQKLSILDKQTENEKLQSEVLAAQKSLSNIGNTLAHARSKRKHMQDEQTKLKTQIQQRENETAKIKNELSAIRTKLMTTEETVNELDKIYEIRKAKSEQLLTDKNKVMNLTFNVKNEIKQLQSKISMLTNQLDLSRIKQTMLSKEESKLKQLIMDKKETLYHLSVQLETIRIQIAEVEGTVDIDKMHDLQEQLKIINVELNMAKENQLQLEKQLKSTESEFRRITKDIEKNAAELETTRNRVEELTIRNEGGEKQIQSLNEQIHSYHMEEMMVNLKMEQMKKLTENECEKVYSIAQQREELTWDINKRKAEVAAIYERMNVEKKLLLDEMSSSKRRLDALVKHIQQRRNKYEILLATIGTDADDGSRGDDVDDCKRGGDGGGGDVDDNDRSWFVISGHRIRVLQEKLELQDTGDRLDERVQKLQTEIRAMENTLHVLNASNSCYKSNLSSVNPESDEYKEKIALDETYEKLNCTWLQKKNLLKKIKNEIRDLEVQYNASNEELEHLIKLRDVYNSDLERALKEANEQTNKLNRAHSRIQFDMKKIEKNCDPEKRSSLELIKRDIEVRLLRKVNKNVLELMSEMAVRHIEVEPTVKQYLSEKELDLPTVSGLTLNRIKSSCGSSAVSLISSNGSVNSGSDKDRKSSYSVVNLEPTPRSYARKSDTSVMKKSTESSGR